MDIIRDYESDASSVTLDFLNDIDDGTSQSTTPDSTSSSEIVDLTIHEGEVETRVANRSVRAAQPQPPPQAEPAKTLEPYAWVDEILYKPGQSVELHDDTFLLISSVWKDAKDEIFFKGRRLIKARNHVGTYIPKWEKELIWIANETSDVPLGIVRCFRTIHFTNESRIQEDRNRRIDKYGLFCRLKEIIEADTVSVEYLSYDEADPKYRVESSALRQAWRGETRAFGSAAAPLIVLDEDENITPSDLRKYTFGDGFCGAGGVSCGAEGAGLDIKWAFDLSPNATATYRLNFQNAECEMSDIFSFLTNHEEFLRVDVTHGSPPCQTFSPAHTIESVNDDANSACIFSCGNLIRQAKPRVHTMEETSGLFERHKQTFYGVIRDFIETGYSVRWAILKCMEYGVPQLRKRLIVIASGPGETLPPLPMPTHGLQGSGLRELTTINQAISNIPPGTPDHDVEGALIRGLFNRRAPFDGNQQARTITCGGGDNNYHPSGERGFTNREYACLQTFPLTFRFGPREVLKQIGNAVPPLLAKVIYGEIIRSLQETDERELRQRSERGESSS